MATGFPMEQWGTGTKSGTMPEDVRQMVAASYHSYGIISGCEVSTSATAMSYAIADGVAVGSRGASYGAVLSRVPSGTVTTGAAPASGSRIDVIYAMQHDPTQGNDDGLCVLAIVQGSAGSSPAKPDVPTGGIELAAYLVPAGITTTAGATAYGNVIYAIPYGASLGRLVHYQNAFDGVSSSGGEWYVENSSQIFIPTNRLLEFRYARCMNSEDAGNLGSILVEFMLDGVGFVQTEILASTKWETHLFSFLLEVPAGAHTVSVRNRHQSGGSIYYRFSASSSVAGSQLTGMTFDVVDRGGIN